MIALPVLWAALLLSRAWAVRPLPRPRHADGPARTDLDHVRAGVAAVGLAAVALVIPLALVPPLALVVCGAPAINGRRERRRRREEILRSLPEVVDLFRVAVGAGLTVSLASEAVARRVRGPLGGALGTALDEVALGRRLGDALADIPTRTDEATRPLIAALVASDRYGAPLSEALGRLAAEVRADRRRRAEEAARKVPVKLLFPLVGCVLPAFALLTVAPLIAGAVSALRL